MYTTAGGAQVATFASFYDSGESFIDEKGSLVSGVTDPKKFATILHHNGFGVGNKHYVSDLTNVIGNVAARIDCPQLEKPQ